MTLNLLFFKKKLATPTKSNDANDVIVVFDKLNNKIITLETKSNFNGSHVMCTKTFPITASTKIEITLKSEKKLFEVDLIAKTNFRENCKCIKNLLKLFKRKNLFLSAQLTKKRHVKENLLKDQLA